MDNETSTWMSIVYKTLGMASDSYRTAKEILTQLSDKVKLLFWAFEYYLLKSL
jgi:hypothetical protein